MGISTREITPKKIRGSKVGFSTNEIRLKKVHGNNVDFFTIKITSKKSTWKQRGFSDHRNYVEKSRWKKRGLFDKWNYIEKLSGNNVDFSTVGITSKKLRGNNDDFSTIKITSKKVYLETTWIFRSAKLHRKSTWGWPGNSSNIELRRIDVMSTSNPRRFDMESPLGPRWFPVRLNHCHYVEIHHNLIISYMKMVIESVDLDGIENPWAKRSSRVWICLDARACGLTEVHF